jgi:hypothetical protein
MSDIYSGRCLCGAVRFEATGKPGCVGVTAKAAGGIAERQQTLLFHSRMTRSR